MVTGLRLFHSAAPVRILLCCLAPALAAPRTVGHHAHALLVASPSPEPNPELKTLNEEMTRRLDELREWAAAVGDDTAGVEAVLPTLQHTINGAVALAANGSRLLDDDFLQHAEEVYHSHNRQTVGTRNALEATWGSKKPLGNVSAWDLLKLLHFSVDNTDSLLYYTSQFIHCLQVYALVEADIKSGIDPRFQLDAEYADDMRIGALVHDLGKSLSLLGVADGNVDCMNRVMGHEEGTGLDGFTFQFNHDTWGFLQLLHNNEANLTRLPQRVLDVARFHSLREMRGLNISALNTSSTTLGCRKRTGANDGAMADAHSPVIHIHMHGSLVDGCLDASMRRDAQVTWSEGEVPLGEEVVMVDGNVVTSEEQEDFNSHVTSESELRRAAFVQHFSFYDLYSKERTEVIPTDVDIGAIKQLLSKYIVSANLTIEW